MTAEVVIMNKRAIAMATDSAITSRNKIYTSGKKLFRLSSDAPVGIMIYGTTDIMEIPWETVIKLYRKQLNRD